VQILAKLPAQLEIQERLGHKDVMAAGNIYSHITKSMEAKSIKKFPEYMADSNTF
jgi:integrase